MIRRPMRSIRPARAGQSRSMFPDVLLVAGVVLVAASCSSDPASTAVAPTTSSAPISTDAPPARTEAGTTLPTASTVSPSTTNAPSPTTTTVAPVVDPDELADISMTSVPSDVIAPTSEGSLDAVTNPINGRRGPGRPPENVQCVAETTSTCLTGALDALGFDITSASSESDERSVERATAVVQLDAGLPVTGLPDDDLFEYLGFAGDMTTDSRADEVRRIGTSAKGRPITALRFGEGPRTVLVVGQTHGDEEGGLRVLLRARSLALPAGITLWVVPTMNPDGLAADTRFLADGADPNRHAPGEPEQKVVYDFALDVRPALTVWYHQNYGWIGGSGASAAPAKQYQAMTGLGTLKHSGDCAKGFMWCPIDDALHSSSILVELPDVLTPADVQLHARALLAVAAGNASG